MSAPHVAAALREHLPPTAKLLLVALANIVDPSTDTCCPTADAMADVCGVTRLTILQTIKKLEAANLVLVKRRSGYPSSYRLLLGGTR
ncbi:helix-turn-helix domain-containing protein [Paraburkholderia atlantica]|uniref:helix-turn-helix domain-containing protein n=1 Tax=Paraburkholderia atlantica TaxID=2654982 RepID=UPI00036CFFD1|nr:helix-turn-helix domain-containing protein [Paraburkholderia atlantica]